MLVCPVPPGSAVYSTRHERRTAGLAPWRCRRCDALEGFVREPGHRVPGDEVAGMYPPGVEVPGRLRRHHLVLGLALVYKLLDPRTKRDEHVARRLECLGARRIPLVGDDPGPVVREREHLVFRDDRPGERTARAHVEERIAAG